MGFVEDLVDSILGTDSKEGSQEAASQMSGIANALWGQTDPMRRGMISNWENMFSGDGVDVSQSPMFGAGKHNISSQYNIARDNIKESMPAGGSLLDAIGKSYTSEAGDMAGMMGSIGQDEYNKAYGMATGAPQQAMAGLGAAGGLNAQNYSSKLGKTGDLGMGAGYYMGGKD